MTKEIETNVMTFRGQRWEEMTTEERTESIQWAKAVCHNPKSIWRDWLFACQWLMRYEHVHFETT